jgi:hypothetical protein
MPDNHNAGALGRLLAMGQVAHSLSLEAGLTTGPIFRHPVALEPHYSAFDPLQTFQRTTDRCIATTQAAYEWTTRGLILPVTDIDAELATRAVAGHIGCQGPVSLECWMREGRVKFYIGAQPTEMPFVIGNWLAAYPQSAVVDAPDPFQNLSAISVLYDVYSPEPYHRAIRSAQLTPWRQFFHLCTTLDQNDELFLQCVFAPTHCPWQRNMARNHDAERSLGHRAPLGCTITPKPLDEPLFAAVLRIGATTPKVARSIATFLGMYTAEGKPLRHRNINDFLAVLDPEDVLTMLRQRTTHTTGQLLTASELALFVHPPDRVAATIVHLDLISGLPVPDSLRGHGIPLGVNTTRGVPIPVIQPLHQHNKSCWMIGRSRTGKSSAIVHRVRFLAEQGLGLALIDPHRSTAFDVLGTLGGIDPERIVFFDFDDLIPVAYNPFADALEEDYGRLTTEYVHSLKHLFGSESFHRMNHLLGMGIFALFVLCANLVSLLVLFSRTPEGDQLRRRVIANVKNAEVRRFWQDEFPNYRPDAFAPIINRLSALLLDDRTLRTFSGTENRVHLARWMDEAKIVIIAPPASIDAAAIVGGSLIAQAKQAAFRRTGTTHAQRHFHLVVDEWHRFITSATTVEQIINECGKGGLSVSLANQETGQIPADLLKAVFSIPNIFVFGVNLPDARALAHLFNGHVTAETLAAQGTGSVYARIDTDIVNYTTPTPLVPDPAVAARIIAHSRERYHMLPIPQPVASRRKRVIDTLE